MTTPTIYERLAERECVRGMVLAAFAYQWITPDDFAACYGAWRRAYIDAAKARDLERMRRAHRDFVELLAEAMQRLMPNVPPALRAR